MDLIKSLQDVMSKFTKISLKFHNWFFLSSMARMCKRGKNIKVMTYYLCVLFAYTFVCTQPQNAKILGQLKIVFCHIYGDENCHLLTEIFPWLLLFSQKNGSRLMLSFLSSLWFWVLTAVTTCMDYCLVVGIVMLIKWLTLLLNVLRMQQHEERICLT